MYNQIERKIFVQDKRMFIEIVNDLAKERIRIRTAVTKESVFVIIIADFLVFQDVNQSILFENELQILAIFHLALITERYLCPILNNPAHGRIQYEGHSFYSRLFYECNPGYTVVGPKERICVSDGFWEPVVDVYCIRKGKWRVKL